MASKKRMGPLYVAFAALFWSFGGVGTKYIPWNPLSIICIRGAIATLTVGILRRSFRISLQPATIASGLCMCGTIVLYVISNKLTTAANAIVFQYTAPAYVILISLLLLKKKPRVVEVVTVICTFLGISLFFIDDLGGGSLAGDVIALCSGVTYAVMTILNSLPSSKPQDATMLGCILTTLFFPILFFDTAVASSGVTPFIVVILLGVFQLGLPYYLFAKGIQETGAVACSIITTSEPILNPIWVFFIMGERPGIMSIIGAAVVITCICAYNVITAKQAKKPMKENFS